MLTSGELVKQSLGLHLFFLRIMKEHAFFLEAGFLPKDNSYAIQADSFRKSFDGLLAEVIALSSGVVCSEILQSEEVVTPYTLKAELVTACYTGIRLQTELTQAESGLASDGMANCAALEQRVANLNERAIRLTNSLIQFKNTILMNVLSCSLFTVNYPLLIEHIMREAKFYVRILQRLQSREEFDLEEEALTQEAFWNCIMAEHAKFIRGLLDPSENELITTANIFGNEFCDLAERAKQAMDKTSLRKKLTRDSLDATEEIRDFKTKGTQGLIDCKIKSIIIPLLGDHVLREANHYLRLLRTFEEEI